MCCGQICIRETVNDRQQPMAIADCISQLPKEALAAIKKSKNKQNLWFGIIDTHAGVGRREAASQRARNAPCATTLMPGTACRSPSSPAVGAAA
jgi:hypothetical protein